MKFLNTSNENANWQTDLLRDLAFIKKHRRYPLGKRTIAPAALTGFLLLTILRLLWPVLFISSSPSLAENGFVKWGLLIVIASLTFTVVFQSVKVLRFDKISVPHHMQENIDLLKLFFKANHLAYSQHPEAPEVFMILSRNLDANPNRDYREVMVFIADDKQILVNSHFTGKKFNVTPPSRNYKRMSKELQRWLNNHINNTNNTTVPVKVF